MRTKNKNMWLLITAGVLVALAAFVWVRYLYVPSAPDKLDNFAQCLRDKGAVFYGAFWCPHCQNQKKMFGGAQRLLPYVECSTPDAHGQLALCREKGVTGYPTWMFADGSVLRGEVKLPALAEKTGCALPTDGQ